MPISMQASVYVCTYTYITMVYVRTGVGNYVTVYSTIFNKWVGLELVAALSLALDTRSRDAWLAGQR